LPAAPSPAAVRGRPAAVRGQARGPPAAHENDCSAHLYVAERDDAAGKILLVP